MLTGESAHDWLRERLKQQDVRPVDCVPYYGRVRYENDDTGYDDDWTATSTADVPDDPDTLAGAEAEEIEEEVMQD